MKTATEPLGHLTPFVEAIARDRVLNGETLTPELMVACIRQAMDEDNKRCMRFSAPCDYESGMRGEERRAVVEALSLAVYNAIPKTGEPTYNPRFLQCEKDLGHRPTSLEYILWVGEQSRKK